MTAFRLIQGLAEIDSHKVGDAWQKSKPATAMPALFSLSIAATSCTGKVESNRVSDKRAWSLLLGLPAEEHARRIFDRVMEMRNGGR
jgi:hypothetical protein